MPGSLSPGSKDASEYTLIGRPLSPAIHTLLAGNCAEISARNARSILSQGDKGRPYFLAFSAVLPYRCARTAPTECE